MTNLKFDDFVKKQFSDYAPDVPSHIWENIAEQRKKKRRAGFWLFNRRNMILLLCLLGAGGGAWWLAENASSPSKNNLVTASNEKRSTNTTDPNNNLTSSNSNNHPDEVTPVQTDPASGIQHPVSSIRHPASNSSNQNKQSISTAQQVPSGATKIYSPLPFLPPSGPVTAVHRNRKTKKSYNNVNDPAGAGAPDSVDYANDLAAEPGGLPAAGTLMARLMYTAEKLNAKRGLGIPKFEQQQHGSVFPKCPRIDAPTGNQQYVEFYAGPDIAIRSFTDTGNSTYLQKRKESETFSSAFSAGVRYTKVFGNGISLRTGANYSQINEKFTYKKGGIIQYVYILDQATGDTIGSYTINGTRYKTSYNRYRSIDIPLQLGYEMGNGRLHLNMAAGAMVNIYSWQRGDVLDTSLAPVNITTGKNSTPYGFKTNMGVGFLGSVTLYYKLTTNTDEEKARLIDRMHLLLEPYFRYNFRPMSKENFTLTQKYSTTGIRLGIRIDLK